MAEVEIKTGIAESWSGETHKYRIIEDLGGGRYKVVPFMIMSRPWDNSEYIVDGIRPTIVSNLTNIEEEIMEL